MQAVFPVFSSLAQLRAHWIAFDITKLPQDYGVASSTDVVVHNFFGLALMSSAVMIPCPNTKTMIVRNGRRATSVCRTERSDKFHSVAFQFSVEPTMDLLSGAMAIDQMLVLLDTLPFFRLFGCQVLI